jgi:hypothetical protein
MCSQFLPPLRFGAPKYVSAVKQVLIVSACFIRNQALKGPRRRALPGLCNDRDYQRKGSFFIDRPVERRDTWYFLREVSHAGIASAEEGDLPLRERKRFLEGGEEYRVLSTKKPC